MDNFTETLQALGCLGWAMAVILAVAVAVLYWTGTEADVEIEELERENNRLESLNDDLSEENKALQLKAADWDKMQERAVIVQTAYEQYFERPKNGHCKTEIHTVANQENRIDTSVIYLN